MVEMVGCLIRKCLRACGLFDF